MIDTTPKPSTHCVIGTTPTGDTVYYTGAAGEAFVSRDPARAFVGWYEEGAQVVAGRLNRMWLWHGIQFRSASIEELSQ